MNTHSSMLSKDIKPFRLIFHIGAGKTGTSSIQASLSDARGELQKSGYDYWGLMLEFAPVQLYEWQKASASKIFLDLDPDLAKEQVKDILMQSIDVSRANGIHTVVWSNEWFFGRHRNVIPALQALKTKNVIVEIIAYVRRHDAWAKSAYIQWGVKHKTYHGPLMPFSQYIKKRPVRFASTLEPWVTAFQKNFMIRNFDMAEDVVKDFVTALNLPQQIKSVRVNEAPGAEELLLRALYNNTVKGESLPVEFDRRFQTRNIDLSLRPSTWLAYLLPTEEDLSQVIKDCANDLQATNSLLTAAGQPKLSSDPKPNKEVHVDMEKLNGLLMQILFRQGQKIQHLQKQLNQLAAATNNQEVLK